MIYIITIIISNIMDDPPITPASLLFGRVYSYQIFFMFDHCPYFLMNNSLFGPIVFSFFSFRNVVMAIGKLQKTKNLDVAPQARDPQVVLNNDVALENLGQCHVFKKMFQIIFKEA